MSGLSENQYVGILGIEYLDNRAPFREGGDSTSNIDM